MIYKCILGIYFYIKINKKKERKQRSKFKYEIQKFSKIILIIPVK